MGGYFTRGHICQGAIVTGGNFNEGQFHGGQICWGAISQGVNHEGGNIDGGEFPEEKLYLKKKEKDQIRELYPVPRGRKLHHCICHQILNSNKLKATANGQAANSHQVPQHNRYA